MTTFSFFTLHVSFLFVNTYHFSVLRNVVFAFPNLTPALLLTATSVRPAFQKELVFVDQRASCRIFAPHALGASPLWSETPPDKGFGMEILHEFLTATFFSRLIFGQFSHMLGVC